VDTLQQPMKTIGEKVATIVAKEKSRMHDAAKATKDTVQQTNKVLSGIQSELKKVPPTASALKQQQALIRQAADAALDVLRKDKQPNVVGSSAAKELRDQLLVTSSSASLATDKVAAATWIF